MNRDDEEAGARKTAAREVSDRLRGRGVDDSHFVLPRRVPAETIPAYIARIDAAAERLRRHPGHPD